MTNQTNNKLYLSQNFSLKWQRDTNKIHGGCVQMNFIHSVDPPTFSLHHADNSFFLLSLHKIKYSKEPFASYQR
jgi:hypothetical protein